MVGPPWLWRMKREFQIFFLREMGLKPQHYFLDLGCGTLRGGIPIIDYIETGHYYGVDVRPQVLEEGKAELREANLEHKQPVLIHTNDLGSLNIERGFDFIWAFSVLIHMTDQVLDQCLGFVQRHLKDEGRFYANVIIGRPISLPFMRWREFPIVVRKWEFYDNQAAKHSLRVKDMGRLSSLGHKSGFPGQDRQRMLVFEKK